MGYCLLINYPKMDSASIQHVESIVKVVAYGSERSRMQKDLGYELKQTIFSLIPLHFSQKFPKFEG